MFLLPTALIYSSHNRCEYLHHQWIVNRALGNPHNKTIFYLPFAMGRRDQQEYSWGTFRWYFDRFRSQGLKASTFFWNENLTKHDAEIFFAMMVNSEVVILGGGNSGVGTERYNGMGGRFFGDWGLFARVLHERQAKGKLTVGFSAGAIQLGDATMLEDYQKCYALIHNVSTLLHYEWGQAADLQYHQRKLSNCLVFGLPNDSGIASNQGYLKSGNKYQILQFIIDNSWDLPQDQFHIKSRQGLRIEHRYLDGRKWTFNGGDTMVRVFSPDYKYQGTWIVMPGGDIYDYWKQRKTGYRNIQHILASH